jgi:hypothetical protein
VRHWRISGEIVPLLGITAFMFIGMSVSGMDAISGMYLGLALLGGDLSALVRVRRTVLVAAPVEA